MTARLIDPGRVTSTVETRFCPVCGFTRHASTTTANPRRWAA